MSKMNCSDNSASYVRVPLTKGYESLVSACDAERVLKYKWTAMVIRFPRRTYVRAYRQMCGGRFTVYLARFIMGLEPGDKRLVDHINHDTLDDRRENLRIVTHLQNRHNARKRNKQYTSRFIGVVRKGNKWVAKLNHAAEGRLLGRFQIEEEAAMAWNVAARKTYGEFAHLNAVEMG